MTSKLYRLLNKSREERSPLSSANRRAIAQLSRASHGGLVRVSDAAKAWNLSRRSTAVKLHQLARRGWLKQAARGLYLVLPLETEPGARVAVEDPWVLATQVFAPCYIAGWSAAEHWGLTEQLFHTTLVATAASTRENSRTLLEHTFQLVKVPAQRIAGSGIVQVWRGPEQVPVSSPARTLVDGCRSPRLVGGVRHLASMLNAYSTMPRATATDLIEVAEHAANGAAWKRLGYLVETLWPEATELIETAHANRTAGNIRLDPGVKKVGRLVSRWRLQVNVNLPCNRNVS